jgi:nucleoside-diphosphate-sugar epimerase
MRVVIAGGHGQIALRLEHLLSSRGDEVVGIIRNADHAQDLVAVGAQPVVCDLESTGVGDVVQLLKSADAAVFAAGAGPGSGTARKETVDRAAAVLFADAAEAVGVRRFIVISSMGTDREPPEDRGPVFAAYLRAKSAADAYIRSRAQLEWTILRPGHLTNDPGAGRVTLARSTGYGDVTRDDVAAVLAALVTEPRTIGLTLELINGDTPITEAVTAIANG